MSYEGSPLPPRYEETLFGVQLVAEGDRLTLRRNASEAFRMLAPIGVIAALGLGLLRLLVRATQAVWALGLFWTFALLLVLWAVNIFAQARRGLVVRRDGRVSGKGTTQEFGPDLRVFPRQVDVTTLLFGVSPTHPEARLRGSPFFGVFAQGEAIAACVNDFLGHPLSVVQDSVPPPEAG